jgi:hypothetical protein
VAFSLPLPQLAAAVTGQASRQAVLRVRRQKRPKSVKVSPYSKDMLN